MESRSKSNNQEIKEITNACPKVRENAADNAAATMKIITMSPTISPTRKAIDFLFILKSLSMGLSGNLLCQFNARRSLIPLYSNYGTKPSVRKVIVPVSQVSSIPKRNSWVFFCKIGVK